ncbi:EIF3F [Cordylochernes scorpioides]|uniref:EIF3F n=1 Tax=Cordylochernes scorpioides TaxID=51811 RepID=A0ABY6LJF6_9ARAC|nr:EIF3F [Cordylochernes scorpioides]
MWCRYATGPEVTAHSVLIHEYYSREANNPIHLTVDTSLAEKQMKYRAYTSSPIGVPGMNQGNMFSPCKVEVVSHDAEQVGTKVCQETKFSSYKGVKCSPDLDNIYDATKKTQEMLGATISYIDDILMGKIAPDNHIGRQLMDLVQSVPQMDPDDFHNMFNSNMNDLLMVIYLGQLARSNLTLHERLSGHLLDRS